MPNPLRLAVIADTHFEDVRLPFPPGPGPRRPAYAMGAPLGRLLGYEARTTAATTRSRSPLTVPKRTCPRDCPSDTSESLGVSRTSQRLPWRGEGSDGVDDELQPAALVGQPVLDRAAAARRSTCRSSTPASSSSTSRCASVPRRDRRPRACLNSLKRTAPSCAASEDRERSSGARGGPPRGGPPRAPARSCATPHAAASGAGSSASSSTSSSVITGWNVIARARRSGTSSRSARFRSGRITSVSPAACAASTFCFSPPIGSTRPCSVTSPVIPTVCRTGPAREERGERGRHRDPGARPVLRDRARRHVDVERRRSNASLVDAELVGPRAQRTRARSAPTPSSRRRAGR